jgi:2-polyprenyl-6-methoxyphenol hydroxylase-like FAD-dependent oxidoreductase
MSASSYVLVLGRPFGSLLVPPPWFRDRMLLVGDAAHTSHMASSARIAIEDAIVLTELLQSDVPVSELLEKFVARRYEHCRMVVESSNPNGDMGEKFEHAGRRPGRRVGQGKRCPGGAYIGG